MRALRTLLMRVVLVAAVNSLAVSVTLARDRGVNQPGAAGGTAGAGAPGAGARDPGVNQPGAAGNRGAGAPGAGARDPGFNQPGIAGNIGGVARQTVRRY